MRHKGYFFLVRRVHGDVIVSRVRAHEGQKSETGGALEEFVNAGEGEDVLRTRIVKIGVITEHSPT